MYLRLQSTQTLYVDRIIVFLATKIVDTNWTLFTLEHERLCYMSEIMTRFGAWTHISNIWLASNEYNIRINQSYLLDPSRTRKFFIILDPDNSAGTFLRIRKTYCLKCILLLLHCLLDRFLFLLGWVDLLMDWSYWLWTLLST